VNWGVSPAKEKQFSSLYHGLQLDSFTAESQLTVKQIPHRYPRKTRLGSG